MTHKYVPCTDVNLCILGGTSIDSRKLTGEEIPDIGNIRQVSTGETHCTYPVFACRKVRLWWDGQGLMLAEKKGVLWGNGLLGSKEDTCNGHMQYGHLQLLLYNKNKIYADAPLGVV